MAEGIRKVGIDIGDFVFFVTLLLGLSIVLATTWLAPFVGLGLAAYYVFRGRVSRWALRALVVGIPLAVALGLALIMGAIAIVLFLYLNAITE